MFQSILRPCAAAAFIIFCSSGFTDDKESIDERSPDKFNVEFETSKGKFVIEVRRAWAPRGADRFYTLIKQDFYQDCRFFRVVPGFVVQWGINGDPAVHKKWEKKTIEDDSLLASNLRGFVTFAKTGAPNSRSTQLFVNLDHNTSLDQSGFAPFGRVIKGMEVIEKLTSEYADKPEQEKIIAKGNKYLNKEFPELDFIKTVKVVK